MTGLRERKKQRTREQILEAATRLFGQRGMQDSTMEEIAAAAEVSVGTLYNYFGSKTALQLALFEEETRAMITRGAAVVADPGEDGPGAVIALFDAYLEVIFAVDRALLLEAFRVGMARPDLTVGLLGLDLQLLGQLGDLLERLRQRGALGAPVQEAALLLYSGLVTHLIFYMTAQGIEPETIRTQVRRQVEVAFTGLSAGAAGTRDEREDGECRSN
jgi:AcrR family transcriptional regulator